MALEGLQTEIDEKSGLVEKLQNVLAARGAAYFENMDPRVGKVETLLKKSKTLTDKTGQIIGKADIVAGGAENGKENPTRVLFEDGSLLSAKTTIGVPKKTPSVNEDAVYISHFTLPNGVVVKVISGADGAGGHESGDLAASAFLRGSTRGSPKGL
jgi:hypothetical protein